jgi:hypothetical protein
VNRVAYSSFLLRRIEGTPLSGLQFQLYLRVINIKLIIMGFWGIFSIVASAITIIGGGYGLFTYRRKRRAEKELAKKLDSIDAKTSEHTEHHQTEIELRKRGIDEEAERRRMSIQPRIVLNGYKAAPQFVPYGEPKRIIFYIGNHGHLAYIETAEVQTEGFALRTHLGVERALERNDEFLELAVDYLGDDDANSHLLSIIIVYKDGDGNRYKLTLSGQRSYKLGTPSLLS